MPSKRSSQVPSSPPKPDCTSVSFVLPPLDSSNHSLAMAVPSPMKEGESSQRRRLPGSQASTFVVQRISGVQPKVTSPPTPAPFASASGANQLAICAPSVSAFHTASGLAAISVPSFNVLAGLPFFSLMGAPLDGIGAQHQPVAAAFGVGIVVVLRGEAREAGDQLVGEGGALLRRAEADLDV